MTANTRLFGLFINKCAIFIFNYVLINAMSGLPQPTLNNW